MKNKLVFKTFCLGSLIIIAPKLEAKNSKKKKKYKEAS